MIVNFIPSLMVVATCLIGCGEVIVWADSAVAANGDVELVAEVVKIGYCVSKVCRWKINIVFQVLSSVRHEIWVVNSYSIRRDKLGPPNFCRCKFLQRECHCRRCIRR